MADAKPSAFWQLHSEFIFAQIGSGVLIVDQHAAHERVLYERIRSKPSQSQKLLFPVVVKLTSIEYGMFSKTRDVWKEFGFEIEDFRERTMRVTAVPITLRGFNENMFREMVMEIKKSEEIMEGMARMIASKSAVKTGDILTPDEMNSLIDDLFATENPYFCPSGRPTIIKIGLEELKRRFGG